MGIWERTYRLAKMNRAVRRLRDINIKVENERVYYNGLQYLNLRGLSEQERYNVLFLVYYCASSNIVINPPRKLREEIGQFVGIDTGKRIVTTQEGINFRLDKMDAFLFAETYIYRIHEKFSDKLKGRTVLDAGAAFGDTALYFASRGARVIAVEPVEENYQAMRSNLAINPALARRITTIRGAIGLGKHAWISNREGMLSGSASIYESRNMGESQSMVDCYTVSSLMKKEGLDGIDYLKMDCKGAEFLLSLEDLRKVKRYLKIEYNTNSREALLDLLHKIKQAGFEYHLSGCTTGTTKTRVRYGGALVGVRK